MKRKIAIQYEARLDEAPILNVLRGSLPEHLSRFLQSDGSSFNAFLDDVRPPQKLLVTLVIEEVD